MIVTPIPGAHRGNVLQVLRSVHTAAINLGNYHQPEENLLKYLTWATESVRVLNSQIRPKDIDALVRTPQYWALLAGAGQINGRLEAALSNGLIDLEVRQRVEAFDLAVKAFTEQMTRWPESTSVLVLDTGLFIKHPTKFEETDFAALAGTERDIRIVVPMVVVEELDRLKESGNQQVRWRAGYSLAVLDRLLEERAPLPTATVEILMDNPGHARLSEADDEIVDRALTVRTMAAGPVRLITYDTSMAMRAKFATLPVLKLRTGAGTGKEPGKR
ncbi:PIN domain-containing protein [Streptomyces sp. NBC_00250]|uniref:PIN domain-containing protein n=1 Tax=Streptomyces sp. NBC_00250 TaxID=2903641 RepID=UPI002E2CDE51|nr:PIN domain-containing protein [Streptomyces sp. NBC_00250]